MAPTIPYNVEMPNENRPIIVIGAGGIVKDAHLPAYQKAGFEVFGIVDIDFFKAEGLALQFGIANVFSSVVEAVREAPAQVIFDIAIMPDQYLAVLNQLPDFASVLIQKPLGETKKQTSEIFNLCKTKQLTTAANFQLRFAPFVQTARNMIVSGLIGEIYDMEIRLTTHTPWGIFPGIVEKERLEILYHSIHYLDLIRYFLGEPHQITAKSFGHPLKAFSSTRSTILLDYGKNIRALINTNHDHEFGAENQESFIKWEGTKGAIKVKMGVLLDYPFGAADKFEYCITSVNQKPEWKTLVLDETWFPDAFIGIMSQFMRFLEGSDHGLVTGIDDAMKTMDLVEAAYESNKNDDWNK